MIVFIPIKHGVVIMDYEDRVKFSGSIKSYDGMRKINIVTTYEGKSHHLHRLIMNVKRKDLVVDHKNGNRFDMRKKNLRTCKVSTNNKNKADYKKKSGLPRGVRLYKETGNYVASITVNKKTKYIGTYPCPILAHNAFVKEHKKLHGKNSVYNVRKK